MKPLENKLRSEWVEEDNFDPATRREMVLIPARFSNRALD